MPVKAMPSLRGMDPVAKSELAKLKGEALQKSLREYTRAIKQRAAKAMPVESTASGSQDKPVLVVDAPPPKAVPPQPPACESGHGLELLQTAPAEPKASPAQRPSGLAAHPGPVPPVARRAFPPPTGFRLILDC